MKLLPCPFCGGEVEHLKDRDAWMEHPERDCPLHGIVMTIDSWNTRHPDERVKKLMEAFKKIDKFYSDYFPECTCDLGDAWCPQRDWAAIQDEFDIALKGLEP